MDETHWWTLPRLKQAHQTMLNNLPKRKIADPWMLEITTAPEPGTGSVAEATMDYAKAVDEGRVEGRHAVLLPSAGERRARPDHEGGRAGGGHRGVWAGGSVAGHRRDRGALERPDDGPGVSGNASGATAS